MTKKAKSVIEKNKEEIKWNIINSLIAGVLVLFGSFTSTGFTFTLNGILSAICGALIVAVTKFSEYWKTQEKEYLDKSSKKLNLFNFM